MSEKQESDDITQNAAENDSSGLTPTEVKEDGGDTDDGNNITDNDSTAASSSQDQKQQPIPSDPRELAIHQAARVLDSLQGGEVYLNGFNLLQVIANPRGNPQDLTSPGVHGRYFGGAGGIGSHSRHGGTPSRHGRSSHGRSSHGRTPSFTMQAFSSAQQQSPTAAGGTPGGGAAQPPMSGTDIIQETYYQLESTLVHVTEQLDTLNQALEEWSRKILEEDPYASADDLPEAQLRELPAALQTSPAAMNELQSYLSESGVLAHRFRELEGVHQHLEHNRRSVAGRSSESVALLKEEIPAPFWNDMDELDLTHPETFQNLFFAQKLDLEALALGKDKKNGAANTSIFTWFPLVPPDSLNPWLDKVEIALLEAVREQSHAFFEESIRFATLQEWIESLLVQVASTEGTVNALLNDSIRPMQTVPADHAEKQEWQAVVDLLDSANELIRCKASIPGYLSAADDLAALDQVYYGRQQLKHGKLTQLHALQGITKQLDQYEELIVTNLREELVESFLDWNFHVLATSSAATSTPSSSCTFAKTTGGGGAANTTRVRDIVSALAKCHGLRKTVQAYNTRLQDVMRLTVRTVVSEFADGATSGAAGMTLDRFLDCLDMTMEQLLALMSSAAAVDAFCVQESLSFQDENINNSGSDDQTQSGTPMATVVTGAAELSSKSISEMLRLRKDAHSLLSLDEMKRMWDKCTAFATHAEDLTRYSSSVLRSTLLAQAKAFVERKHDSNMGALVAALDSERWTQCDVSTERQMALTRLCTGRALLTKSAYDDDDTAALEEKEQEVEVNGVRYKVVWSCLLLVEMVIGNLSAASHFTGCASSIVGKVADLLRLFNSRTTQLVLGAKAIHSAARLKSINAKHLSLVTQCLGLIISILPNIRASLMAQLPSKQHRLLSDIDQIKKEYAEHNEKVMNKFVTIIGGIIEHHLAPKLPGTDFDARAREISLGDNGIVPCCVFLEGISSNTNKMHHVLHGLLPPEHLQDVFSRIFAYVDHKIPTLFSLASQQPPAQKSTSGAPQKSVPTFRFPQTNEGKQRMLLEAETLTQKLNGMAGVQPWDFTLVNILERTLEYSLNGGPQEPAEQDSEGETEGTTLPSDTEDPAGENHGAPEYRPNAEAVEPVTSTASSHLNKEDEERTGAVDVEDGADSNGSGKPPDYPVEVTTL